MIRTLIKEITEEQYKKATIDHDTSDVFTMQEVCGYGVYCEHFYEQNGKYYVSYQLGSSCD